MFLVWWVVLFILFFLLWACGSGKGRLWQGRRFFVGGTCDYDLLLAEESYCFLLFVRTMKDHSAPLDNRRGRTSKVWKLEFWVLLLVSKTFKGLFEFWLSCVIGILLDQCVKYPEILIWRLDSQTDSVFLRINGLVSLVFCSVHLLLSFARW